MGRREKINKKKVATCYSVLLLVATCCSKLLKNFKFGTFEVGAFLVFMLLR